MKLPSKLAGIVGRNISFIPDVTDITASDFSLLSYPDFLILQDDGGHNTLNFKCIDTGRSVIEIRYKDENIRIPVVVFKENEFFLCMAISSNYHFGWDPLAYLFGGGPENLQLEGHAFRKTKQLEKIYHNRNIPITWFIDKYVAEEASDAITDWHYTYGDDYGVMPTSYFNHNEVNYNTTKSLDETKSFVSSEIASVEKHFAFGTRTLAIDQWVGSIGTNFVHSAYELGMTSLWGIGYDHRTCDTSMFHRGCPWDVYKPSMNNFRIPADHPSNLWIYQWTTRDIVNTIHTPDDGPGGSVIFSTDADDINISHIMQNQPDYWSKLLREYKKNTETNDFFVFLIHQEDHDCHFPQDAEYIRGFLDDVIGEVTPATIEEVTLWLNMKYASEEHPSQSILMNDPLDCHDQVQFYAGVNRPDDWPSAGEHYPVHAAYYGPDSQWIAQHGSRVPLRWYDYKSQITTGETDSYPSAAIPDIMIHSEQFEIDENTVYQILELESDISVSGMPIITWDVPADIMDRLSESHTDKALVRDGCIAVYPDIQQGTHKYRMQLK